MFSRIIPFVATWAVLLAIPVSADLVGYWKLDQGSGTEVWDYAAPYDDAAIAPANEAAVAWTTAGYKGSALDFLVSTPPFTMVDAPLASTPVNIEEASYSFWLNMPTAFQAWGPVFVLLGGAMDHSIECDGAADLFVNAQGGSVWFGTKGAALNDGQWHNVTVTYSRSGNAIVIYVDGVKKANTTHSMTDSIATVRIGGPRNRNQWRRFIGKLDEVAVWNNGLSEGDVKNVFWISPQWANYATNPDPNNGLIMSGTNVTLKWTAGATASQHRVYLSETLDDVKSGAAAADKGLTQSTTFSNHPWALGKTYYWRIDEVESNGTTVYTGTVWNFTISAKMASNPSPANGAVLVDPNLVLSWIPGSGTVSHDVYFGTSAASLPRVSTAQAATAYAPAGVKYDTVYYWRIDEFDGATTTPGAVWTFKTSPQFQISDPNLVGLWTFDRDEPGIILDWSGHGNHGKIFGNPASIEGYSKAALSFDGVDDRVQVPQVLSREANAELTLTAWIKTSVPGRAGATAREGSGLLWADHAGGGDHFTVAVLGKKLAFETGPGGNPNTISNRDVVTGDWVHVAVTRTESTRECVVYVDGALDASSIHAGDSRVGSDPLIEIGGNTLDGRYFNGTIDEVRAYNRVLTQDEIVQAMRANPLLAWNPKPVNGGLVDVRNILVLGWSAGDGAVTHDVYMGTDADAVMQADVESSDVYRGEVTAPTYLSPDRLQWGKTYYWRIDETQANGSKIQGRLWSFKVADYLIVDDVEGYDDTCKRIFFTWIDGYGHSGSPACEVPASGGNGTGSTVGNLNPPFAERTVVHGGRQSMPFGYDNTQGRFYSETGRDWSPTQSWTAGGVNTLVLWLRGDAAAFAETSAGAILMNGTGTDIWSTADECRFAYKLLKGNGSITAKVESLTNTHANAKAGVMIRESLTPEAVHALVDVTPGAGLEFIRRIIPGGDSASTVQTGITAPYWIKLTRTGDVLTAQCSADGKTWASIGTDPAASSATIPMAVDLYIGLAVTSHAANVSAVAKFSNVSTTGGVSGAWQTSDIGVTQIAGNPPETFYVRVADKAGHTKIVSNPDPTIIGTGVWQVWNVPLSQFSAAGVNLDEISKFVIGVGDPVNPKAGGKGRLCIDDIQVIKSANP